MKNKIYKVLGIVLTMAIIMSTCLCAFTTAHAETTAVTLVQGTIDGGVIKDGAANRAYTKDLISLYENVSVSIASGYKAAYHIYDYQGNWIKYIGNWQEGTMKTMTLSNYDTKAFYFRIVIGASSSNANGDNSNFKVADLPADVITFDAPQDTVNGFVITPALVSGTVSGRANTNLNTSIQDHATRMYPFNIYEVAEIESLTVTEGHRAYVHYYGADGMWVGGKGWLTGTNNIGYDGATYFRVTYDTASGSGDPDVNGITLKMYAKDVTVDGATTPVMIAGQIVSAQGGKILSSTNRIYTKNEYLVADYEKVTIADGYRMVVHFWDADGAYIGESGWQTDTKTLRSLPNGANATYFRVVAGDSVNSDPFTPDNFPFGTLKLVLAPKDVLKDFVISPALVSGTINGAPYNVNTCFGAHSTRLATYNTYKVADVYKIEVAADCRIYVQFFKADGTYNAGSGWQGAGKYTVSNLPGVGGATYFRITFSSTAGGNDVTTPPADGLKFYAISEQKVDGNVLYPAMAKGTVNGGANITIDTCVADHNIRLHTYNVLKVADIESITVPANCRAFIHFFNEDGSYNGPNGWITTGTQKLSNMGPVKNGATQFQVTFDSANGATTPSIEGFCFKLAPVEVPCEHVYDNACDADCNVCGETREVGDHVYENYTSNNDATCTQNATETGTCACGATDTREVADSKLDHTYVDYTSNGDATCTADGTKTGTCVCGATDTIVDEGSMLDHTYVDYTSNNDATCTTNGTETGTCACGATDTREVADSKLDHTYVDYTFNNDATCTTNGTETGTCACGATDTREVADSKLDHTYVDYTSNNDATCTTNGTETGTCACGATDTREVADSKLDHTYVDYTFNNDATCTTNGTETGTCVCGATDTREVADSKLDHTYVDYTSNNDATCTADGTKTGTCVCGATDTIVDEGSMLDHTYADYTSNNDATCTADGTKTGTCVCGATDTIVDEGSMLDHTYSNDCDADCNECGATREVADHIYDNDCDADCNVCGETREVADHVYDNACDTDCNVCGATREVGDHVYDNACDADCNNCGDIREVADHVYDNACDADCDECGEVREVGDHVYDNACDADCNECGATREVADHVYDNACDADCNVCGATREVADHIYDNACDADCNECGATREVADHVYENDCDADCNECGATREVADHIYDNACDTTCNVCGDVRTVGEHKYNTDYDIDCNICGAVREAEGFSSIEIREYNGGKYIYVDGRTSVKGLFKVDGDYYFADWGGKVVCGQKVYVKSSYCDLPGGKEYTFGEDGKILNGIVEIDGVKYLYFNGITAVKGIFKIDGDYYFSDWGGVIKVGTYYTTYVTECDLPAGEYTFGEDGKMLNNVIVEKDGNKVLYVLGKTAVPGLYKVDGNYYAVTWGGVVRTNGKFYVKESFCDKAAGFDFICDANGVIVNI